MNQSRIDGSFGEDIQEVFRSAAAAGTGRLITLEDMAIICSWAKRTLDGDDEMSRSILLAVIEGQTEICLDGSPEPKFRLSMAGREHVELKLRTDPEMRELMGRLDKAHGTQTRLPPLEGGKD